MLGRLGRQEEEVEVVEEAEDQGVDARNKRCDEKAMSQGRGEKEGRKWVTQEGSRNERKRPRIVCAQLTARALYSILQLYIPT